MFSHLYEMLRSRAERFPNAVALGSQDGLIWQTVTSREMLGSVDALAGSLASRGISPSDRVVLWLPSSWWTPVYYFAIWKLGAIVVPFDREMNADSAQRVIEQVDPRAIIVGHDEHPRWAEGHELTEWWEPDRTATPSSRSWQRPTEELAVIAFTSGTTGNPKGCMITHGNLCSQIDVLVDNIPLDEHCRLASILPLSHLFELTGGLLYPLSAGAAIHYVPSRRGPDIVRVFSEQQVTHMIAVPQLLTLMGHALDEQLHASLPVPILKGMERLARLLPLSARRRVYLPLHLRLGGRLRMLAAGGAALPEETQRLWEGFGVRVVQGYGTSECSPVVACGLPDGSTPIGSVGRAVRGTSVRISDDGELQVAGPNVMRGYWKDEERTAEVLSSDGWYSTGDLASIDPDGNIKLTGRAKDLIVLPSGLNVWPQDVEDVLRAQPGVKDAAIVLVLTASGGATLHAYLIPGSGATDTNIAAIVARANGSLAQHQRVANASWWPDADFPRTPTLKVRRHLLPVPELVPSQSSLSLLSAADDPVAQVIAGVARLPKVADDQTLEQLGIDSLGLVDLALALEEKAERPVADGDLRLDMTVADVRELLMRPVEADQIARGVTSSATPPLWPYGPGRAFRVLGMPFELIYRYGARSTTVLGGDNLRHLGPRVIVAGTHHGFPDIHLIQHGLRATPAGRLSKRLVIAASAANLADVGAAAWLGILAFGTYPLNQHGERDASLRGLATLMQRGNAVLIFPQGTHADPEQERAGDPQVRFRPGVAHLAEALQAEVVPFGIAGTERLMPSHVERFHGLVLAGVPVSIKPGPLVIAFSTPLRVQESESPRDFTQRLQDVCFRLTRDAEVELARRLA